MRFKGIISTDSGDQAAYGTKILQDAVFTRLTNPEKLRKKLKFSRKAYPPKKAAFVITAIIL